jgi:putative polyhydroxyalkanoate system protein
MSVVHIERKHDIGKAAARNAVEEVARQMKGNLQIDYRWDGDTLKFERPGANGTIAVSDSAVIVDIELGMMLSPFSGMVEQQVGSYLDKYFAE